MRFIIPCLSTFVAISLAHAQETHTIKLKIDADLGKTINFRTHDVSTGSMKFFDADNKQIGEEKKEGAETSYRLTTLERDKNGKPTKFIRVYDKAFEKEAGKTNAFSYQGRTVLFEKVGDKFRVGVVGEPPLAAKDVGKLIKDVSKKGDSNALLRNLSPGKAVKVGDSWSVPVKPVAESMEDMPADLAKSKITAKLEKVYTKGKSKFATFDVDLKFFLTSRKDDDGTITFNDGAMLTAKMKVDIAIDGSSTERTELGTMAMKGEGKMSTGGMNLRIEFNMSGDGGDEISAETDDPKARVVPKVVFAPTPGDWTEFKQKDHAFEAKFPGVPEKKSETNKEGVTTTEYGVQLESGRVYYAVTVSDYPADKFKLDAAAAYANLKKQPNVKESSDIKIGGIAAVELKQDIKKKSTIHLTQRVVIVGQRMYQLLVVTEEGRKADAKQFFDSFQLDAKALPKKDD